MQNMQNQCLKCCKLDETQILHSETTLVNCFSNLVVAGKHGLGTMWRTHRFLRSCVMVQCKVSTKDFVMLRLCAKSAPQDHVASKPVTLLCSETKLDLTALLDEEDDEDLLCKTGIIIVHFGVLRRLEILQTQIKDVAISDLISVECPRLTKRRKKGFRFKLSD